MFLLDSLHVALLAEGVDRNFATMLQMVTIRVALLAEGVDRNKLQALEVDELSVALLAEGVDRNFAVLKRFCSGLPSPSSQRAWIEISRSAPSRAVTGSPSSQRAWIEIMSCLLWLCGWMVALLAEGVDRNQLVVCWVPSIRRRPPRRGRG